MDGEQNYLTSGRPRGFSKALWVAVTATVATILLAIWPAFLGPAGYDPTLAVLTATLIALVWYTFFTFLAATHLEPSFVSLQLDRDGLELEPRVENPTRRSLHARIWMRVWAGGIEQPQSAFYSREEELFLGPEGRFKGCVQAKRYAGFVQNETGAEIPGVPELLVMLRAKWTDDSDESGDTGPRYYRVPVKGKEVISVVASANIESLFPTGAGEVAAPGSHKRIGSD